MTDHADHGLVIAMDPTVVFIPRDELRGFVVPDDVAEAVLGRLRHAGRLQQEVVDGDTVPVPVVSGARLDTEHGPVVHFSSLYEHALTLPKLVR